MSTPSSNRPADTEPAPRDGRRRSLSWSVRWGHTYLSLLGAGALVFFALTGLTLNHPGVFEAEDAVVDRTLEGTLDPLWCKEDVARLEIVEQLRAEHGLRGRVQDFTIDDWELALVFAGPGYGADVTIDRESGAFSGSETRRGAWARLHDLHKGTGTGGAWSWVIDVAAVVLFLAGCSGLWLVCYVKRRRRAGLVTATLGAAAVLVIVLALEWV
ncbi:MAG: PepSY-associated TM helix domain-containing protein [Planctomycetota bacterium]|nr:PepSY-associated TM helix domain-containing protein [Planctomycetota bacterium]